MTIEINFQVWTESRLIQIIIIRQKTEIWLQKATYSWSEHNPINTAIIRPHFYISLNGVLNNSSCSGCLFVIVPFIHLVTKFCPWHHIQKIVTCDKRFSRLCDGAVTFHYNHSMSHSQHLGDNSGESKSQIYWWDFASKNNSKTTHRINSISSSNFKSWS